jgi:hypothetical protein
MACSFTNYSSSDSNTQIGQCCPSCVMLLAISAAVVIVAVIEMFSAATMITTSLYHYANALSTSDDNDNSNNSDTLKCRHHPSDISKCLQKNTPLLLPFP